PPLKVGESYGDLMAGLYASWAILAALFQRNTTGEGSTIDVAMFDALFSLLPTSHALQFYAHTEPKRTGNRHPLSTPFGCFQCADGQAVIAVLGDGQWGRLCTLIGAPEAMADPAFATDEGRTHNEPVVKALIETWTKPRATVAVVQALSDAGIPTAPIQTLLQAAKSPHAVARGLVSQLPHHSLGMATTIGQPVHFNGEKHIAPASAPDLGAQTDAILADLGLDAAEIARLHHAGVIQGGQNG
ncbi:MAG: CoA transferase, partial [Paracoccaceae bacterium]